ncbi:MAG TPA: HD domain-containing phosphohydrolase [Acidobacteriota bacterium]|nr:HD domain-containing phosphohydrolase [Acidobacteriota bacterium]
MDGSPDTPDITSARDEMLVAALKAFFAAWRAAAVYDENNQGYQARRAELTDALQAIFKIDGEFAVVYQNDYFFINGRRLNYARDFTIGRSLATRFAELQLGGLTIQPDALPDHFDRAIFALAQADRRADDPFASLSDNLMTLGVAGMTITRMAAHSRGVFGETGPAAGIDPRTLRRRKARTLFQRTETVVQEFWERIRDRNSFEASPIQRVVHQLIDEVARDEDVLLEFAALKDFDEYTFYHSVNVAVYSIAVGMRLGLDRTKLASLGFAALLHDIGKVRLPRDLITKPSEYDENDWEQIKRHPALGALTIANARRIDSDVGSAMAAAFEHHLKMDLSGYPAVTRRREPHLFSRIVTICDIYDAMTAGRVYQKAPIPPDEAVRRILYKGREWHDPLVLKAFVNVVGIFPVGTLVRLSDGTAGIVTRNDANDLYCPHVLLIRSAAGEKMQTEVSLAVRGGTSPKDALHITDLLDPRKEGIHIEDYIGQDDAPSPIEELAQLTEK